MTFATTVPTFFMRLKPTSSIAKPACMNITKQAATITHTVSAATPAACVAVVSSARAAIGISAASKATVADMASTRRRRMSDFHDSTGSGKYVTSRVLPGANGRSADGLSLGAVPGGQKRVASTNWRPRPRAVRTGGHGQLTPGLCVNHTGSEAAGSCPFHLIVCRAPSYDHCEARQIFVFVEGVHGSCDKVGQ